MPGTPGLSTFHFAAGYIPFYRDLGKCRDLVSSPQHHVLPPEPETSDMDGEGGALTPGVYLCEVAAETGRGRFQSIIPVAVAY